jgi:hypothetical protein
LTPRDPHWLYAHWDLAREQQHRYNALAADGHLAVRVYRNTAVGQPLAEAQVHPESEHWFVQVPYAGMSYLAELGYYQPAGHWVAIAASALATTPSETPAKDKTALFATLLPLIPTPLAASQVGVPPMTTADTPAVELGGNPPSVSAKPPATLLPPPLPEPSRLTRPGALPMAAAEFGKDLPSGLHRPAEAEDLERDMPPPAARPSGSGTSPLLGPPTAPPGVAREWTPEHERALAEAVGIMARARRQGFSSAEVMGILQRRLELQDQDLSSPSPPYPSAPLPTRFIAGITSPPGTEEPEVGFAPNLGRAPEKGFNLNAELVIYGATEPGAKLTIGEQPVGLRPDGTFSFRFALPDGNYELTIAAAAHGEERQAGLKFSRRTEYLGDVGAHRQDALLPTPPAENARA